MQYFGTMSKFHCWHQLMMLLLKKNLMPLKKKVIKLIKKKTETKDLLATGEQYPC